MTGHKFRRAGVAALGVLALGAAGLLATSSAAVAAEEYEFGNIVGNKLGSLTVHKFADQASGGATGHPDGNVDGTFTDPIKDVVFTAYLLEKDGIPVDLTTFAGWEGMKAAANAVAGSSACAAPAGYELATEGIDIGPTDEYGVATSELPVGAYVVCETSAPSTVTKRNNPFLVTIPFPVADTTADADKGWLYDVHVYPKNTLGEFSKTIEEQLEFGVGSAVDFTITGSIPDISPNTWTEFTVTDTLDSRLDAIAPLATLNAPTGIPGVEIDYDPDTRTVIVRFTDAAWLKANAGAGFDITVHTTVNAAGVTGIENTAQQWVNNPDFDPEGNPPTETPEVVTNWGTAKLMKVDSADGSTGLKGAEFEVYAAATPYVADPADCSVETEGSAIEFTTGSPAVTSTKVVSDANGVVNVPALFVSDSVNGTKEAEFRCYVLVETKAPAGYVTPVGDSAKRAMAISIGENDLTSGAAIENSRQVIPGLPLTGAQGQVLLIAGGIAAAAVVVGLVLVNRRRQNAAL